jgi:hypothetical protein
MRYLRLVILVSIFGFGLNTAAFAACCTGSCVENGYGGCWLRGTFDNCATSSPSLCRGSSGSSPGGGSGGSGNSPGWVDNQPSQPPPCPFLRLTKADRDAATDQCVEALSASARLIGCAFEDAAGKAEDQATGLSCPTRQAALASQCRSLCASFAVSEKSCQWRDDTWQSVFSRIGGFAYGSARVDLCGPPIRHGLLNRTGRGRRLTP